MKGGLMKNVIDRSIAIGLARRCHWKYQSSIVAQSDVEYVAAVVYARFEADRRRIRGRVGRRGTAATGKVGRV